MKSSFATSVFRTRFPTPSRRFPFTAPAAASALFFAACGEDPAGEPAAPEERAEEVAPGETGDPAAAPPAAMDSSRHVRLSVRDAPESLMPGERHTTRIRLEMDSGWHVMANPASMDFLIPTEINLPDGSAVTVEEVAYPEGEPFSVGELEESNDVYKETVDLSVVLAVADDASAGEYGLSGTVRVQACDDSVCLAPATLPLTLTVPVRRE